MTTIERIVPFFDGWQETMIWSCLQGCMGYALTDDDDNPTTAQIVVGDFCFFAGTPSPALAARAAAPLIVPRTPAWGEAIEAVWGDRVRRTVRYAIRKEPNVFDPQKLAGFIDALDPAFTLRLFDEWVYGQVMREGWSADFCSQFADYDDFSRHGLGVVALWQGKPVAGAASYSWYRGGIEIEIDTRPEFRRRGLATACGAALILECLRRGLYPSWDAHDLRSVALAEKLGYHRDAPYTVYFK